MGFFVPWGEMKFIFQYQQFGIKSEVDVLHFVEQNDAFEIESSFDPFIYHAFTVCSQTGPKRSGPNFSGPKFLRPERFSITPIPAPTLPAPVQKCNHINLSQNCNRLQPFRPQSKMHQYRSQSHTFYYFRELSKRDETFFFNFSSPIILQ